MITPDVAAPSGPAARQAQASATLMGVTYAVAGLGFFLGGLLGDPALAWVCTLSVAVPTLAGFVRHVLLWRGDAARLGFETRDPSWMWEVGAANLALAVAALLAGLLPWGVHAQVVSIVAMAVYMAGATVVHALDRRRRGEAYTRNGWVSIGLPAAYTVALAGFAVWALV